MPWEQECAIKPKAGQLFSATKGTSRCLSRAIGDKHAVLAEKQQSECLADAQSKHNKGRITTVLKAGYFKRLQAESYRTICIVGLHGAESWSGVQVRSSDSRR